MITFVDTNILLDVFLPDPKWGYKSKKALDKAFNEGSLLINEMKANPITKHKKMPHPLAEKMIQIAIYGGKFFFFRHAPCVALTYR